MMCIRKETPSDLSAIRHVHTSAFPTAEESLLVDRLRSHAKNIISLVAEVDGAVVGHILFSPVKIETHAASIGGLGLAPVAVLPEFQHRGIGKSLIEAGLIACQKAGFAYVVVLGSPGYYKHFGFEKASKFQLRNVYGVDDEFMVKAFEGFALPIGGGLVRYSPEFGGVDKRDAESDAFSELSSRVAKLESQVQQICERNRRVEADKAWEISRFRVVMICLATYLITALVFRVIGVADYWLSALIPAVAYFISAQTFPFVKEIWIKRHQR